MPRMVMIVRGVNKVRAKSGAVYYYHRKTGSRIKAEYGTPAFALEVARLDKSPAEDWRDRQGHLGRVDLGLPRVTRIRSTR